MDKLNQAVFRLGLDVLRTSFLLPQVNVRPFGISEWGLGLTNFFCGLCSVLGTVPTEGELSACFPRQFQSDSESESANELIIIGRLIGRQLSQRFTRPEMFPFPFQFLLSYFQSRFQHRLHTVNMPVSPFPSSR